VLAAELALPHRIKARPFQDIAINAYELEDRLEQVQSEWGDGQDGELSEEISEAASGKKKA
jgi:hypothetical protein